MADNTDLCRPDLINEGVSFYNIYISLTFDNKLVFFAQIQLAQVLLVVRALEQRGLVARQVPLAERLHRDGGRARAHRPRQLRAALRPRVQLRRGVARGLRELEVALRRV